MPSDLVRDDDPQGYKDFMAGRGERDQLLGVPHERETDGLEDAWTEPGSDELMPIDVLAHVKAIALQVELERARKIARRGE